jgi:hypothetical protein
MVNAVSHYKFTSLACCARRQQSPVCSAQGGDSCIVRSPMHGARRRDVIPISSAA